LLCHTVFESRDYCCGGFAWPLADVLINGHNGSMLKHRVEVNIERERQ